MPFLPERRSILRRQRKPDDRVLSLLHSVSRRIVESKNKIQQIARFAVLNA
jgi:hypothetical protein